MSEMIKLKWLMKIRSGDAVTKEAFLEGVTGYPVFGGGKIIGYHKNYNAKNSILIGRVGVNCGQVTKIVGAAWATDNALVTQSSVNIDYLYYILQGAELGKLNTANAQPLITASNILNQYVLFHKDKKEQTAIVSFLDNKCGKIDLLIENEEKTIVELKEYKKTFIQEAIEGSNESWKTYRFTSVFSLGKGLNITKANLQEKGVLVVSYGEIHSKYGRELNPDIHRLRYVDEAYLESDKASLLKHGDFIFADTSEDLEGAGNFTFLNSQTPVFAGYHTIIARPKIEVDYMFLSFLCDSYKFRAQIQKLVTGIKVFSITKTLLKKVDVWLPPLPEQKRIAAYLDKKTKQVDNLIAVKQQKIIYLKEYKKSLIYEYVTGKKEVPA